VHFARSPAASTPVIMYEEASAAPALRGLHSFNFQLNVSAFYVRGGAFRGYLGAVYEVSSWGVRGCLGCVFVSETAQVVDECKRRAGAPRRRRDRARRVQQLRQGVAAQVEIESKT